MAKCNSLFQDEQEKKVESAYQAYVKEVLPCVPMSFEEFVAHYTYEQNLSSGESNSS